MNLGWSRGGWSLAPQTCSPYTAPMVEGTLPEWASRTQLALTPPADPCGGPARGREAQSHREGLAHLFELALLVQPVNVSQHGAPVCVLQLEDADQRLHKAGGALGEEPDRTGLQRLQCSAALEAPDPTSVEAAAVAGVLRPGWAWCRAASACSLRLVGGRCGWAGAQTRESRLPGTCLSEAQSPTHRR